MDKLRELRKENNLTQKELSEKTGIPLATLSAYERGTRKPKREPLTTLANFFQVPTAFFYELDAEKSKENFDNYDELKTFKKYLKLLNYESKKKKLNEETTGMLLSIFLNYVFAMDDNTKKETKKIFEKTIEQQVSIGAFGFREDIVSKKEAMKTYEDLLDRLNDLSSYKNYTEDFIQKVIIDDNEE